jgi:hypothetical protein
MEKKYEFPLGPRFAAVAQKHHLIRYYTTSGLEPKSAKLILISFHQQPGHKYAHRQPYIY